MKLVQLTWWIFKISGEPNCAFTEHMQINTKFGIVAKTARAFVLPIKDNILQEEE